jgi:hypothetical protein
VLYRDPLVRIRVHTGKGSTRAAWRCNTSAAHATPKVLHGYVRGKWTDDTAITWAKQGIEAAGARAWQLIRLTPAEANELSKTGKDPL